MRHTAHLISCCAVNDDVSIFYGSISQALIFMLVSYSTIQKTSILLFCKDTFNWLKVTRHLQNLKESWGKKN